MGVKFTAMQAYRNFKKPPNKQSNLTPTGTRKAKQTKHKVSRRKKIIKIRAEINEIE